MKNADRAYIFKYNLTSGDQYSFIGVDSNTNPGPKAPFNFFGVLKKVRKFMKDFLYIFA